MNFHFFILFHYCSRRYIFILSLYFSIGFPWTTAFIGIIYLLRKITANLQHTVRTLIVLFKQFDDKPIAYLVDSNRIMWKLDYRVFLFAGAIVTKLSSDPPLHSVICPSEITCTNNKQSENIGNTFTLRSPGYAHRISEAQCAPIFVLLIHINFVAQFMDCIHSISSAQFAFIQCNRNESKRIGLDRIEPDVTVHFSVLSPSLLCMLIRP